MKEENQKIKYRLYIDEVGSPDISKKGSDKLENIYFGLCGIIMSESEQEKLRNHFYDLKNIVVKDKDLIQKVSIHRKDILDKRSHFAVLQDKEIQDIFNKKLLEIFIEIDFDIIFCAIDKHDHNATYSNPAHPYNYMFDIMLEKYIIFLEEKNARGDIMIEGRGEKENTIMDTRMSNLSEHGILTAGRQLKVERIKNTLTSKHIKFVEKKDCVAGVELADLLAIPCLFHILGSNELKDFKIETFNYKIMEIILGQEKLKTRNTKFIYYDTIRRKDINKNTPI